MFGSRTAWGRGRKHGAGTRVRGGRALLVATVSALTAGLVPGAAAQVSTPSTGTGEAGPISGFAAEPVVPLVPGVGIGLDMETSRLFTDSTFIPPDTMGAVGPDHIVEMINGNFEIFDKYTGASLETRSLDSFWINRAGVALAANGGTFDPRVVYDPPSGRWFAVSIDRGIDSTVPPDGVLEVSNNIFVARTNTSDPTGTWQGLRFVADTAGVIEFHDYPSLAVDADGLFSCTQDFNGPGNESCYSIPKADIIASPPTVANLTRFEATPAGLPAVSGSWQPALDFGASDGRAALLGSTGTALRRTSILGAGAAGATLAADVAIAGDPGHAGPPAARQPADDNGEFNTIENVAPRFVGNVFELGNSLWAVHSVLGTAGTPNAALRWYEINETTNTVIQTGLIEDTVTPRDFHEPTIAANAHGDVVIGYSCSGPTQAVGVCASLGTTGGGVTTFGAPVLVTPGAGDYYRDFCTPPGCSERNRWGDYSAVTIDPSNPCTFWSFQMYVGVGAVGDVGPGEAESGNWSTRVSQLVFEACQSDLGYLDFGDAPNSYGTLLASDGARHTQVFGAPFLGADLDVETNGSPSAAADGDDNAAADDEDGVTFAGFGLIAGVPNKVTVTASSGGGLLRAWIDFNDNGSFSGTERIANNVALAAGPNVITFNVPVTAVTGGTYARFRVSTSAGLNPTGLAPDGEVEDYTVSIVDLETFCAAAPPPGAIVGTNNSDAISGGPGDDIIFGLGGHDLLEGGGGNDILCGGDGNDLLRGGGGSDGLAGGNGNDRLEGQGDDDLLVGSAGFDRLYGQGGNDVLIGGTENDLLDGGAGTNSGDGGDGPDSCVNGVFLNCP